MRIFIIGPGGVGKTTSGAILAKKLNYQFIDLDHEFCNRIKSVGQYIQKFGYESYCYENSKLFYTLLSELSDDFVLPLSSGFLVHEDLGDLTKRHQQTLRDLGCSILLLPSTSIEESTRIVVTRQLLRGFGLNEQREKEKFMTRFIRYQEFGDIKVYSSNSPESVATEMKRMILTTQTHPRPDDPGI